MKRLSYLLTFCACMLLCACSPKNDITLNTYTITETYVSYLSSTEATINYMMEPLPVSGKYQDVKCPDVKKYGVYYSTTNDNPMASDQAVIIEGDVMMGVEVPMSGLQSKTHYYVRGFVRDALESEVLGDVIEFTTK